MQYQIGLETIEKLKVESAGKILDVGCGDGRLATRIAEKYPRGKVTAVDLSKNMLDLLKKTAADRKVANITPVQMDAMNMTFTSEFDAVYSNFLLNFLKDHKGFYQKVHDALKPGGLLIVTGFQHMPECTAFQMDGEGMVELFQQPRFREYAMRVNAGSENWTPVLKTRKMLEKIGFADITAETRDIVQQFPSVDAYFAFMQLGKLQILNVFPEELKIAFYTEEKRVLAQKLSAMPADQQKAALTMTLPAMILGARKSN